MKKLFWMTRREFSAYFFQPMGWFLISGFLAVSGWYFSSKMEVEATTDLMRSVLVFLEQLTLLVIPLIAMRTVAVEKEEGTLEGLLTAPVTERQVVGSKFLGGFLFYLVLLAPTVLYAFVLNRYGSVDPGPIVTGYAGTVLAAGFFLSLGLLLSTLSPGQFAAAVFSFLILFSLRLLPGFLLAMDPGPLRRVLLYLNYRPHLADFRRGVIDTRHLVYFVSSTGLFLFCAVRVLKSRRWR